MIYVLNHLKSTVDELATWVKEHPGAVVVDARRKVVSPKRPSWSKDSLRAALRFDYVHLPAVGTTQADQDRIDLLRTLAQRGDIVVLYSESSARGDDSEQNENLFQMLEQQAGGVEVKRLDFDPVRETLPDEGLNVNEAAEFLGITPDGIRYHLNKSKSLRRYGYRTEDGKWRFTRQSLEQWKQDK
jgi:hypothetical protein